MRELLSAAHVSDPSGCVTLKDQETERLSKYSQVNVRTVETLEATFGKWGFPLSHLCTEFCSLPSDEGQGIQFMFALYYDAQQDQCQPFIYKGEGGNANRFENERECIRNCSANAETIYPTDASEACHYPKAEGSCGGKYLRYYYHSVHKKCKKFLWSGCIGNGNRFLSSEICNKTCDGIQDDPVGDEIEDDEPDTPIAIICGVLLALIVVAIFTTVIVLTVKSKKKKSKKSGGKSKEADTALQEQRLEMS
ncbi:tissue factor pathway inhibitor [Pagrus major]|uniref:tissue factor pathway inhibitor n=1 Tax=Pagrus major TaxID=143350 RepID=UPI003CC87029